MKNNKVYKKEINTKMLRVPAIEELKSRNFKYIPDQELPGRTPPSFTVVGKKKKEYTQEFQSKLGEIEQIRHGIWTPHLNSSARDLYLRNPVQPLISGERNLHQHERLNQVVELFNLKKDFRQREKGSKKGSAGLKQRG